MPPPARQNAISNNKGDRDIRAPAECLKSPASTSKHGATPPRAFKQLLTPEWCALGAIAGWKKTADVANSQNTTFGVLSVLLITLSFPAFVAPPDFTVSIDGNGTTPCGIDYTKLANLYGACMLVSFVLSLTCTMLCTIGVCQLSLCTNDHSISEFFERFGSIMGIIFAIFMCSVLALCLAAWAVLAARYSLAMVLTLSTMSLVALVAVLVFAANVFFRFTLKHLEADYTNMTKVPSVSGTKVVPLPAALKPTQDGDEDDK